MTPQPGDTGPGDTGLTFSKILFVAMAIFLVLYGSRSGMYDLEGAKYLAAGIAAGVLLSFTKIRGWKFIPAVMLGNAVMAGLINGFSSLI
jgi:hypothetical protein